MHFVGLDLAWGEKNQTGVAVVDADGRLLHLGVAQDDESIETAVAPYVDDECLVAIDAPLIVQNETGARPCEAALNRDFTTSDASARPAYRGRPEFNPPRGEVLANRLGPRFGPASQRSGGPSRCSRTRRQSCCSSCKNPEVQEGRVRDPEARTAAVDDALIEGLDNASPRLRVNRNVPGSSCASGSRSQPDPAQLDRDEDPVDAVICAYVALYRFHRPEDVTIYGDFETGYIVTPTLSGEVVPQRATVGQPLFT